MSLTSSSTLDDAFDQYMDNLSWDGDATKAAAALEAIRYILLKRPQSGGQSGRSFNYESMLEEKKLLEAYVQKVGITASAARASFVRARGVSL